MNNIKKYRKEKGYNLKYVASLVGISKLFMPFGKWQ